MPKFMARHLFVYTTKLTFSMVPYFFMGTAEIDIDTSKLRGLSIHFVSSLTAFKMADGRWD